MSADPVAGPPAVKLSRPMSIFYRITSLPPPPPPPKDSGYRPNTPLSRPNTAGTARPNTAGTSRPNTAGTRLNTATTARFSRSTTVSTQRTIKYATWGRFRGTELSPQPSDDPGDPLNWPRWKKELNFAALLLTTALASATKTALIPVNSQLASRYDVSYASAAALTAVPLVVSAFSGLACVTAAKVWGKRPVYLVSVAALFIGSIWGMRTLESFRQSMAARVFQGLGWGAFDTLVLASIYDTYFEHERGMRITIYNVVSTAVTWGAPLLGGLASERAGRFTLQFEIISAFFAVALPLMALGTAETTFDHAWSVSLQTPASARPFQHPSLIPLGPLRISKEQVVEYLRSVPPWGYKGSMDTHTLIQAPRAFAAPTTMLVFAASFLPHAGLWALAGILSLVFSELSESSLGSLLAGPFVFSTLVLTASRLYKPYAANFNKMTNLATLAAGTALSLAGILSFGLLTSRSLLSDGAFNYPLLSFLLALLAAGSTALEATGPPLIYNSSQYTSSNLYSCLRNVADMTAGATALRALFAGIILQAVAVAVEGSEGALARHAVGIAGGQALVVVGVAAVWVIFGERVRRWDGKVMGLVDLSILKGNASFFEYD